MGIACSADVDERPLLALQRRDRGPQRPPGYWPGRSRVSGERAWDLGRRRRVILVRQFSSSFVAFGSRFAVSRGSGPEHSRKKHASCSRERRVDVETCTLLSFLRSLSPWPPHRSPFRWNEPLHRTISYRTLRPFPSRPPVGAAADFPSPSSLYLTLGHGPFQPIAPPDSPTTPVTPTDGQYNSFLPAPPPSRAQHTRTQATDV